MGSPTDPKRKKDSSEASSGAQPDSNKESSTSSSDVKVELTNVEKRAVPLPAPPHLAFEPNPFEHSFAGGGSGETPGSTKLPSVAALTSPASLLPGGGTTPYGWGGGSLRTGPLSPAMLSGPTNDYFGDSHLRGGFPTPNESSLRTGLTPGGGGSMFPQPSPNSQALFSQLASGGATPSTLDFHRTAMNAAAVQKGVGVHVQQNVTSQPQEMMNGIDAKPLQQPASEMFGQHDANDAANGLFLLASQSRNGSQGVNQYTVAQPQTVHAHPLPNTNMMGSQSTDTSPTVTNRNHNGSLSTASGRGASEMSDESERQTRPNTRGKGRKAAQQTLPTGRRKADDNPSKGPASKKPKTNNGGTNANSMSMMEPEPPSEEEIDENKDEYNANGKKMTDEEKRKNFLERNRVAALKCRQRKKQWLANLQQKVEMYSTENDNLGAQIAALREEVVNLKTLLLAHKDCPVTQQQGLGNMHMQILGDYPNQMQNPYGMAMNGQQIMAGQGMRRYS